MSSTQDDVTVEMYAYPTCQPTWVAKISYAGRVIVESALHIPDFSGNIRHELSREDHGTHCTITVHDSFDENVYRIVHDALWTRMNKSVEMLLHQSDMFCYPKLKCKDAAQSLLRSDAVSTYTLPGYEALIMIMAEIPPNTPWDTRHSIGTFKGGTMIFSRPSLEVKWNLQLGYPIMMECIAAKLMKLNTEVH